jgi:hypothetical protein
MAHSIRIADGKARGGQARGVYIPDAVHARIWNDPTGHALPAPTSAGGNVGRFPFLSRLADPYSDATIWPSEVSGFRTELQHVAGSLDRGTPEAMLVADLVALTNEAERTGSGLECRGD